MTYKKYLKLSIRERVVFIRQLLRTTKIRQVRGMYSDNHGGRCAVGAIAHALQGANAVDIQCDIQNDGILVKPLKKKRPIPIIEANDKEKMTFKQIARNIRLPRTKKAKPA